MERYADEWHFNCNLLVVVFQILEHEHLLSIWRVENSVNLTHIKDVAIEDYDGSLQVDDNFITVETAARERAGTKTYNFISTKTFQVERSLSSRVNSSSYDKGYLFLQNKNLIRILNVSSGTFLRDIRLEPDEPDSITCGVNSSFVVIPAIKSSDMHSKLNVSSI